MVVGGVGGGAGSSPQAGRVGRYALHREIGAGGMATIHLGKLCGPAGFAPVVAVKSLHPHYAKSPEFVRMFLDEARLAGRIRHPNVVSVLDVFAADGQLFLVLEYVHGESLGRLVSDTARSGGAVRPAIASAILCDVLHGLHAAHEAKGERGEPLDIVHRDVSPQNILVGVDGSARVLDFGVAKAAGRMQTTQDGQVKGKFAYMPPEQLRGEKVNRQADVYSAAVVLWEALVGRRLFGADSEGTTVQQVLFAEVAAPSTIRGDIPRALDAVVLRGLARERSERFSSAKQMALALEAAMPSAPPPVVGEWVEAHAIDALEKKARFVAEVEVASVQASPGESGVEQVVAGLGGGGASSELAPLEASASAPRASAVTAAMTSDGPLAAQEASTAGQTVPDRAPHEARPSPGPVAGRRGVVVGVAAAACVAAACFLFLHAPVSAPSPSPTLGTAPALTPSSAPSAPFFPPPIDPSPQTAVTPLVDPSAPSAVPSTIGSAVAPARSPKPGSRSAAAAGARPAAGPRAGLSSSPAAPCQRRDADGVITFDKDCLRAAQRRP